MKPSIFLYPDFGAEWKRRWEAGMKKAALKRRQQKDGRQKK
jgi:hypothetical protein